MSFLRARQDRTGGSIPATALTTLQTEPNQRHRSTPQPIDRHIVRFDPLQTSTGRPNLSTSGADLHCRGHDERGGSPGAQSAVSDAAGVPKPFCVIQ